MSRLIRILIPLLFAAAPAMGQQGTPAREAAPAAGEILTLERAIALAVENNRGLQIAKIETHKAQDQLAVTRTKRLPQSNLSVLGSQLLSKLSFEFERGAFGDFPATGPIPSTDTKITTPRRPTFYVVGSISQPLSQLYKINLGIEQSQMQIKAREEDLRGQRLELIHRVRSLYYSAAQIEASLAASRDTLAFYREMDRLTQDLLTQQAALKSDNLDIRARLAQEEYNVLTQQNQLASLQEQLNQAMGRDIYTPFQLAPVSEATADEIDLASARGRALANRSELRDAQLKTRMAEQDRKIKRAEGIPDVSLTFNYISPFSVDLLPKNIAAVGLQLSWEPWDWGRRKREVQEKARAVEQAEISARETETRVLIEVSQSRRKLLETRVLIQVARAVQEATQEKLRVARNRYAEKAVLFKDVLQAQDETAQAKKTYQQAVLAFWSARADFEKAMGEDQ